MHACLHKQVVTADTVAVVLPAVVLYVYMLNHPSADAWILLKTNYTFCTYMVSPSGSLGPTKTI